MENDKVMVITRPNHNKGTRYFYYWGKESIGLAKEKGIKVVDLKVERANSRDFERAINLNPCMVIFNGCGGMDKLLGFNNEILIDSDSDCLFSNKTARIMGVRDSDNRVAYIGHNKPFIFLFSSSVYSPPDDEVAHFFLDPLKGIAIDILNGDTVGESFLKAKKSLKENIKKCSNSKYDFIVPFLGWNMNNLVLIGDKDLRI